MGKVEKQKPSTAKPVDEEEVSDLEADLESESESDEEMSGKPEKIKLDNHPEKTNAKKEDGPKEAGPRSDPESTIFVGNLPVNTKQKQLRFHFAKFGEIQSIRLRSETGKKVMNKSDRKKSSSINAYVAFCSPEHAQKAAEETNNTVFKDHHIRVDLAFKKNSNFSQKLNEKSTVFVGNVIFEATDEDLRAFFTENVGEVEYVRRIPRKGIAFVCFKRSVQIVKALKLTGANFQGRPLRISKWQASDSLHKKEKKEVKRGKRPKKEEKKKLLDTSRPTNNPLIKKIREKTKKDNTVDKAEFKKKYREKFGGKRDEDERRPKKAVFHGKRAEDKKGKLKKKKQLAQKKVKKIAKFLTGK